MKGGALAHIDGVPDEAVNAAFIIGAVYLGWQLVKKAATPSPLPPAAGPPATTLPPPPGGHTDPVAPPVTTLAGTGGGPSLIYHVPAPAAGRDYYAAGPSPAHAQLWDHTSQLAGVTAAAGAVASPFGAAIGAAVATAAASVYGPPAAPAAVHGLDPGQRRTMPPNRYATRGAGMTTVPSAPTTAQGTRAVNKGLRPMPY